MFYLHIRLDSTVPVLMHLEGLLVPGGEVTAITLVLRLVTRAMDNHVFC